LVQFANQKMQESGFKRMNKEILRNEFPEVEVLGIMKGKVGFISPVGHWMRKNPELIDSSFAILDSAQEFNMNRIQRLRNEALDGNFRKISQIWNLIIYAQWIKIQQEDI